MDAELGFRLLSLIVLPWWGIWLAAPRSAWAARAASHSAIFLALCGVYGLLLAGALASGAGQGLGFERLRGSLSTPLGFLAGWAHYLALDLFLGAWIVREARRLQVEARFYLLLALIAGPLGLGAFLLRRALRLRNLGQLGETDLL